MLRRSVFLLAIFAMAGCANQSNNPILGPDSFRFTTREDLAGSVNAASALGMQIADFVDRRPIAQREIAHPKGGGDGTDAAELRCPDCLYRPVRASQPVSRSYIERDRTLPRMSRSVAGTVDPAETQQHIDQTGSAAWYVPKNMRVNVQASVELWIDLNAPVENLQEELAAKLKIDRDRIRVNVRTPNGTTRPSVPGEIAGRSDVWVGNHMTATLRGQDFIIDPPGPRGKSLVSEGRAKWDWTVVPKRHSSSAPMILVLEATIDRGADQDAFPSMREPVEVELAPWWERIPELADELAKGISFLNTALPLLGIAGLGGLIAWFRKWLQRREEHPLPSIDTPSSI